MQQKFFSSMETREDWSKYFSKNNGLIIDLGCGYGADDYWLAKKGYKVIAVDEENNIKFKHPNLIFKKQKIETPINKKFDGVIANFSLHFLPPETRLRTVGYYINSLKPDGIFYILIFDKFVTPLFLKLFPQSLKIEHYSIEENHPPSRKHSHNITRIIYQKVKS